MPQPPWEEHEKPPLSKRLVRLYEGITSYYKDKWKDRWKAGKKGAHSRHPECVRRGDFAEVTSVEVTSAFES
jgi:hypothetical protein